MYINRLYHLEEVVDITGAICISIQLLYSIPHENFEYSFKKNGVSVQFPVEVLILLFSFTALLLLAQKGFLPPYHLRWRSNQ